MTPPNGHPILGERRAQPPMTLAEIDAHIADQLDLRMKILEDKLDTLIINMKSAVPDGDLDGHRRAHEAWLLEAKDRREFRQKVMVELAKGTAWAMLVAVATALWFWFKVQVKS